MATAQPRPDWKTCIDFGTAASKASICAPPPVQGPLAERVHPLRIGAVCHEPNPYFAQSALLFDRDKIFFGWNALQRAGVEGVESDLLHSFKTFLAATDLNEALSLRLKRSVDRSGRFSQRDALVLYVGYLMCLTERAALLDKDLPREALGCLRRYAYPVWKDAASANTIVASIFDAAASVVDTLGDELLSEAGIDAVRACAALSTARQQPGDGRIEAGVFEAQAAAECHFAFSGALPDHVMVFDMGAGTTDITAFELMDDNGARSMREMVDARRTIMLACDEIDRILVSHIAGRAKAEKGKGGVNAFWRHLVLRSRRLKEDLFRDGACEATFGQRRIVVRLGEFAQDKQFASFRAALADVYRGCLTQLSMRAAAAGSDQVGIVLAGGGASLPFIQKMAASMRPSVGRIRRIVVQPLVPDWANDDAFKNQLAPIFPQVAISIGGAVAQLKAADLHF